MKRLTAPRSWKVKRKTTKFITKPNPGPHRIERCMPLNVMLRDVLGLAKNTKEVKYLLCNGEALVDGKVRNDVKFPVGLMDVLSIPKINKYYRMLIDRKGYLTLNEIKKEESTFKPCKITGKTVLKGSKLQVNLSNGYNILVKKDSFKPGETLLIELPSQKVKEHFKLEKGAYVFLTGGRHIGDHGVVDKVEDRIVLYKSQAGEVHETSKKNVLIIGSKKPSILMLK